MLIVWPQLLLCISCLVMPCQDDLDRVAAAGQGRVDITVGSALDIFGGKLPYTDVVKWHQNQATRVVA